MIKPSVGRVVWYRPYIEHDRSRGMAIYDGGQPLAAHIAYVWNDRLVNLLVIDHDGNTHRRTSMDLKQGDALDGEGSLAWCEWMPYQHGQAKKTEAAEATARISVCAAVRSAGPSSY